MPTPTRFSRRLAIAAVALLVSFGAIRPASAVPVFARKYQTSCQTCHIVFPKLNAFGEAFRLNGYRMPAETEEQVKETPVSLGSEAYKKMWPAVVFPGTIPSHVPLAINIKMADVYASVVDGADRTITRNDFQFPQEVNLFAAGTLGDKFGYLAELTFEDSAVSIERAQFTANSLGGPEHAVNIKVGMFAPDLADGFQEMWLMTNNGIDTMFGYNPIGVQGGTGLAEDVTGAIAIPSSVKAIEFYGVAWHRFFYTAAITSGLGPVAATSGGDSHSSKDWYARLDYKFGGMGLDGDTTGKTMSAENWRENSVRVGILGYQGNGNDVSTDVNDALGNPFGVVDRRYDRIGLYVSWFWRDLNVFGVYLYGKDALTVTDQTSLVQNKINPTYASWFVQADYVIRPPFQVSLRYEDLSPGDPSAPAIRIANANFTYLMRANIKLMLEYQEDLQETKNYNAAAVLRFAF